MGEVYQAHDRTLGRDVAIKVLPQDFAADGERRARFEREARLLAAVNHSNIASIYGLEHEDGLQFIVMELVRGRSLSHVLQRGLPPLATALDVGRQVASALEAAHRAGIVHRDLKPANVMITSDGDAKVLDFGIAKTVSPLGRGSETEAATELTRTGTTVGTVPYMSPEQVKGAVIDERSDIWSFGCLLYEMLAGQRAFARPSVAETVSAVLEHDPDWSALPEATPNTVRQLIRRCLDKDPAGRVADIAEARTELEEVAYPGPAAAAVGVPARPRPVWINTIGVAAGLAVAAAAALWLSTNGLRGTASDGGVRGAADPRALIVVLPFENLGAAEDDYFAAGMSDEITSRLAAISGLGVISRRGALRYAGSNLSTEDIGTELGVGYILSGSVRLGGRR